MKTINQFRSDSLIGKNEQKSIKGGGPCGVLIGGMWFMQIDQNGNGGTKDEAKAWAEELGTNWCCSSCPWNS